MAGRMYLTTSVFLVLAWSGRRSFAALPAITPTSNTAPLNTLPVTQPTSGLLTNVAGELSNKSNWACPFTDGVPGISCTCDEPHTVRCRGQASHPDDLTLLTHTLIAEGSVSLLDLAVHGLGKLPSKSFIGMKLMGLIITTAGLETLPSDSFLGVEGTLAALGLPNNKLTSVPVEALQSLRQLQRLDLSDNQLEELPPRAFPTLIKLQNLNLAGNGLHILHPEAFVRLPHLMSLDLARNQLDSAQLNEKTLRGLHSLQRLSLQSNLLKGTVTSSLITGASGLVSLDLSDNSLTRIARSSLSTCPNLRYLDLSHNKIDVIEDHAFSKLDQLLHLKLSHNRVVAVSGWSLAHLPQLTQLSMADNALRAVTGDLLHQLPALTSLDLAANDITLLQPHVFNSTPSLQHLTLTDNPLHCDCALKWLAEWLIQHPTLIEEEQKSAVCATPPALENAPLVELKTSQLVCSDDTAGHDYHDYYHDYYHDDATSGDPIDRNLSDAEISLQVAHWVYRKGSSKWSTEGLINEEPYLGVELIWRVDERATPYSCEAVFVYEVLQDKALTNTHQVLAEKIAVNCTSEGDNDPHRVVVTVPGEALIPGSTYRYCLVLLESGTGDQEAFLPGCSEPLLLSAAPAGLIKKDAITTLLPEVTSLTAGGVRGSLVVHTRVDGKVRPCTYTLAIVSGRKIVATRQLNCSEARHEFPTLVAGQYVACAHPDTPHVPLDFNNLEHHLRTATNVTTTLKQLFSTCTPTINFAPTADKGPVMGPLLILLFTLPGLALVVTLYVIARRVWRGGGVPWRWDPRAQKAGKYFLYTGEVATPSLSLDPLPAVTPETTTPV